MEPAATMAILPWELSKASAKTPPMKVRRNGRAHNEGLLGTPVVMRSRRIKAQRSGARVAEVAGATHAEVRHAAQRTQRRR